MTAQKKKALAALLTARTQEDAARAAGISPRTLREYLQDKEFSAAYRDATEVLLQDALSAARRGLCPALDTLREIAEDAEQSAAPRINAAKAIVETYLRLHEAVDLEARISALEAAQREAEQ